MCTRRGPLRPHTRFLDYTPIARLPLRSCWSAAAHAARVHGPGSCPGHAPSPLSRCNFHPLVAGRSPPHTAIGIADPQPSRVGPVRHPLSAPATPHPRRKSRFATLGSRQFQAVAASSRARPSGSATVRRSSQTSCAPATAVQPRPSLPHRQSALRGATGRAREGRVAERRTWLTCVNR